MDKERVSNQLRDIAITLYVAFLVIAIFGSMAFAQECDDCPEDFSPGAGNVTASYSYKEFVSDGADCTNVQCVTITLNGSQETDGVATYSGITVVVTGTIVSSDNTCCASLAPTVYPIEGIIVGYMGGSAEIEYWRSDLTNPVVQFASVSDGPGTCTVLQITDNTFGQGFQIIEKANFSFSGGACEDDNGEPSDPDDPPDAPDPPDGPDPDGGGPDVPPVDPPDEPDEPDRPNDPDDPDEPDEPTEPDGGDPNDPDPDPTDLCCVAITARLDTMILWADYNAGWNENTFEELKLIRDDMFQFMYDLIYGQDNGDGPPGVLQINNEQNAEMIAQLEMTNLWNEYFNDYFADQTWYLKQLYEQAYEGEDDPSYEPPTNDLDFEPSDPTSALIGLIDTHKAAQVETENEFQLPDISAFSDPDEAPVMELPTQSIGAVFGISLQNVTVDFAPFTTVRNMLHAFLLLIATLGGINIVWEELRKQ